MIKFIGRTKLIGVFFFFSIISNAQEATIPKENIVDFAMIMPSFIGGDKALFKYLADSIRIPETEKNVTGAIYFSCVIDTSGKVRNISILQGIKDAPLTTKEAMRVVSGLPPFKPAKDMVQEDMKKVNVKFQIPVRFPLTY